MMIEELINEIESKRAVIDKLNLSTNEILRLVPQFRLDWGSDEESVSDEYNIGVSKPILLSRLSNPNHRFFQESILFQNNKLASKLVDTFILNKTLTKDLLLQIHSDIIPDGGRWRNQEVIVSDQTYALQSFFSDTNEIDFRISELVDWYNNEVKTNELHPLVLSTLFHYSLVNIHPFIDGNGRLARIISSLILLSQRIPPPIIENKDRSDYIFSLRKGDLNDLKPLTFFIGKRVLLSMELMLKSNFSDNG